MAASTHGKALGELLCLGVARLLLPGTASHLRYRNFPTWTQITARDPFTMLHSSSIHAADAQAIMSFSGTSQQHISRCQMPGETNSLQCGNAVCAQRRSRGFLQFKRCLSSSQCESY